MERLFALGTILEKKSILLQYPEQEMEGE